MEKSDQRKIEIAFCFDENMIYPACVAIASLLDSEKDDTVHFEISCICSKKALEYQEKLKEIVEKRDQQSKICFYAAPEQFDESYEVRGITSSTYLRLMLHRILEHKKNVIYADVDMLFMDSLQALWSMEFSNVLLAGVKGANNFADTWKACLQNGYADELQGLEGNYINAGFLLMNLQAIREWNPDSMWIAMSKKNYHYQDQDILNITCKGQIQFLEARYNVQAHLTKKEFMQFAKESIYSKDQCMKAWEQPAVLHYTGPKPWINRGANKAKLWWNYVEAQEDLKMLFDKSQIPNRKTTGILGKINRHLPF